MSTRLHLPRPSPGANPFVKIELPAVTKNAGNDLNYYIYGNEVAGVPDVWKLVCAQLVVTASAVVANRRLLFRNYLYISKKIGSYMVFSSRGIAITAATTGIILINGQQYMLDFLGGTSEAGTDYTQQAVAAGENILVGGKSEDDSDWHDLFVSNPQTGDLSRGVVVYEYMNYKLGINKVS